MTLSEKAGPATRTRAIEDRGFILRSVELAISNAQDGGEPFGAVLVRDGQALAEAANEAHVEHDPTAHAEIQALRRASRELRTGSHPGTTMYASGKPCPMCMAAMIQAGISRVVYCADDDVGGLYGFSTAELYARTRREFGHQGISVDHLPDPSQSEPFDLWKHRNPSA